ncbi:MAG TPA: DUF4252 domain-containing protein [Prolixibacteraceae bacterium]|nr:DUF4252 domain-containing protein [Prolixibacteraceae bacterium]
MKRWIMFVAMLVPLALAAQKSPVDKLFEKYANQKGFTTVNISGKLLGFAGKLDNSNPETSKMLNNLTGIRILSVDDDDLNKQVDFYTELDKEGFFKNNTYESLMDVTEDDQVVRFYARETDGGKFSELLLVVGGKDDNTLISIRGLIDPENIGKITGALDIDVDVTKGEK